jgi:hypothetical protein
MAEEQAVVEQTQVATPSGVEIITPGPGMFSDDAWGAQPLAATSPKAEDGGSAAAKPEEKPAAAASTDEIVDEYEHLEKQTGYKTWEEIKAARTELEQLRTKAQTPAERKFANEESKKLAEAWEAGETDKVYDYLHTQRQLKSAADLSASEAIRLHLKQTNLHFKEEDIQDIFEERYSIPSKPVMSSGEEQEDFDERMQEYNTRVAKVNRAIERDAVAAKQDLAKRITELVPPEIPKREQASQGPSQKELEDRQAFLNSYVKSIPKEIESFEGFSTTFKDETAEIPISFVVTPEEKKAFQAELESYAKTGLDANAIFSDDWVNKDGTINVRRMAEDRYLLKNRDKIFQKIANESGTKRLAHQLKLNSNIHVDGKKPPPAAPTEKDTNDKMLEHFWKS